MDTDERSLSDAVQEMLERQAEHPQPDTLRMGTDEYRLLKEVQDAHNAPDPKEIIIQRIKERWCKAGLMEESK